MKDIILTEEQLKAVHMIEEWMADPLATEFMLGGFAGTGKTTLIKSAIELMDSLKKRTVVIAYTGKAVNVLQRKGIGAQTAHSLLYDCEMIRTGMTFTLKAKLEVDPDLIIIDEASMISTDIYNDLLSFSKKYLFVGDPGQLEPVGDNPNLMQSPHFTLSTIHRQAAESPIITLANNVRKGSSLPLQQVPSLTVRRKTISSPEFLAADQVIVALNRTRQTFNDKIRIFLKLPKGEVVIGDKLICLRNAPNFGVYNGSILFVEAIKSKDFITYLAQVRNESGLKFDVPIWKEPFKWEKPETEPRIPRDTIYCDYGYAITCHKSQGSEWDKVLVWDESCSAWDMKRWRYTAITRAAKELIYNI